MVNKFYTKQYRPTFWKNVVLDTVEMVDARYNGYH